DGRSSLMLFLSDCYHPTHIRESLLQSRTGVSHNVRTPRERCRDPAALAALIRAKRVVDVIEFLRLDPCEDVRIRGAHDIAVVVDQRYLGAISYLILPKRRENIGEVHSGVYDAHGLACLVGHRYANVRVI